MKTKLSVKGARHPLKLELPPNVKVVAGGSRSPALPYNSGPAAWPAPHVTFYPFVKVNK